MPRWLFTLFVAALLLAVLGSVLVFLRATPAPDASTAIGATRPPAAQASPSPSVGATASGPRPGGHGP